MELKEELCKQLVESSCTKGSNAKIIKEEQSERRICIKCNVPLSKNGNTKTGVQKYICPHCHLTCSETTGSVTYSSKLPFEKWKLMIDNLLDGLSLRKMSKKLDVSIPTAFSMRHKILQALDNYIQVTLTGRIQLDEKYFKINLKGTKKRKMPRASKKRKSAGSAGITNHLVNVLSGVDEYDNLILKIGGLGKTSIDMLDNNLSNLINEQSHIVSDSEKAYIKFCQKNKLYLTQIPSKQHSDGAGNNLADINNIHSQLENWLSNFRGVSTRHLQLYLNWFCYIFMLSKKLEHKKLVLKMYRDVIAGKEYIKSTDISKREFPIDLFDAYGEYQYGIYA